MSPSKAAMEAATLIHNQCFTSLIGVTGIAEVIQGAFDRHARSADEWKHISSAPKDRLIHLWIAATPRGERWSAEDHMLAYCYWDSICSEWRSSRPQGHLVCVPERFVTHWKDDQQPQP